MAKIVMVGGGSVNWSPRLINDLILSSDLQQAEYVIFDKDMELGTKMAQFGNNLAISRRIESRFRYVDNEQEAFTGADYVIITISTGGFDAMENDLKIPEEYRIHQTVGDTVGPGGWARGLRNIPVFVDMAKAIEKYSNHAVVLNYTNPMAVLTNVFYKVSSLRTVGLCHGLFEVYDVLMKIFGLSREDEIKVRFGGTNHFFWILDMKIRGEDGYKLLRSKMQGKVFAELINHSYIDEAGFSSKSWVCSELFEYYGYLPYIGDRHISEFLPHYLTGDPLSLEKYKLERTSIEQRKKWKQDGKERLDRYLSGEETMAGERSRETAADIISAFESKKEFIDVVNLPNIGQISNLPKGSIVETLGVVNSLGFTPMSVGELPEPILNMVMPHAVNQDWIVEAALEGNLEKAFWALHNDPLCAHLSFPEVKEMGRRLLKAQEHYMPNFKL